MPTLPYLDANAVGALPWPTAIAAIGRAVETESVAGGPARTAVPVAGGELLLMPAEAAAAVGVKVLSIAPANPARGLPRIQGVYVLFSADTLAPVRAAGRGRADHCAHARGFGVRRRPARARRAPRGWSCSAPDRKRRRTCRRSPRSGPLRTCGPLPAAMPVPDLADADIVVCATTARTPLFDGALLSPQACVVAIGSHEPDARELDDEVFRRAERVVVEDTRDCVARSRRHHPGDRKRGTGGGRSR